MVFRRKTDQPALKNVHKFSKILEIIVIIKKLKFLLWSITWEVCQTSNGSEKLFFRQKCVFFLSFCQEKNLTKDLCDLLSVSPHAVLISTIEDNLLLDQSITAQIIINKDNTINLEELLDEVSFV